MKKQLHLPLVVSVVGLLLALGCEALRGPRRGGIDVVDYEAANESIVDSLCLPHTTVKEISRVTTINWLYQYFNSLPWDDIPAQAPITQCYGRYMEPLEQLQAIIAEGQDNACSDRSIQLAEEFHRKHILSFLFPEELLAGQNRRVRIPETLRLFFMRYMVELTEACKYSLMRNLRLSDQYVEVHSMLMGGSFGPLVDVLQNYFGAPTQVRDFDDFVHIWDMVDEYGRRMGDLPAELERDHLTGQRLGFMVKVRSAAGFLTLQRQCQNSLRPIYGPLVLPLMRLVDLGYSLRRTELGANQRLQDWYSIAQACEALLPIRVFEDQQLEPGKVEMITREEAAQLESRNAQQALQVGDVAPIEFYFEPSVLAQVDALESIYQQDRRDLIAQVQYNVKLRRQYLKRLVRQLSSQFKNKLKSRLDNFSVSPKAAAMQSADGYGGQYGPILDGNSLDGDYLDDPSGDPSNYGGGGDNYNSGGYQPRQSSRRMKRSPFQRRKRVKAKRQEEMEVEGEMYTVSASQKEKKGLRQRAKRVAIIMILMAVISTLVMLVVWMVRG